MDASLLLQITGSLVIRLPLFAVWIVGLVLAFSRPLPSRVRSLLAIALVIMLVDNLVGTAATVALPRLMMREGGTASSLGIAMSVWGVISTLIAATAWVLLLMAVFAEREGASTNPSTDTGRVDGKPSAAPF